MNISPTIKYIGADAIDLDLFENQYKLNNGMSYNSYVIIDEKIAILDTADKIVADAWWNNLEAALEGQEPHYLVIHHMEPDHSAAALQLIERYPNINVVATAKALQLFQQFFPEADLQNRSIAVKEGDTLNLGHHQLKFMLAPMVHWPEVMVSYDEPEHILFSADAFGKFGALSKNGYTDNEDSKWADEARRYYFNICGKYGLQVQSLLKKASMLQIEKICPLHGPMLTSSIPQVISFYNTWSKYEPEVNGVLVAYASIHGGTEQVAQYVAKSLEEKGVRTSIIDLCHREKSLAVEYAFMYDRTVLAAASYDAGLFTPMHTFLHTLAAKAWQNRKVALIENGSWAPTAGKVMREMLSTMKNIEILEPQVTIKSRMNDESKQAVDALVEALTC